MMMRGTRLLWVLLSVLALVLAVVTTTWRAEAAKPLPVSIAEQPSAPVKILQATSGYEDTRVTSNFYWRMQANVRNVSDKRIVAYELEWNQYNAFDEKVDDVVGVSNQPLAPGAEANPAWEKVNLRGTGVKVTVSVHRVRFEDGTTWAGVTVAQVPGCTDALKAERARLLQVYQTQGFDALLSELRK